MNVGRSTAEDAAECGSVKKNTSTNGTICVMQEFTGLVLANVESFCVKLLRKKSIMSMKIIIKQAIVWLAISLACA